MAKDLTTSQLDRQNILNNTMALPRIQEELGVRALEFEGRYVLTKQMVADYYGVDIRTISRYIESNQEELEHNGYFLCKGKSLKDFKLRFVHDIDVPKNTPQIGLFDFRSFLNIGMLLTESEKAKYVRTRILDIVIATINEKTGGGTKYINRRDREYLPAAIQEENYRKNLTDAINKYVDGHKTYKYAQITDMIYKAVFREKAKEYKKLLSLSEKDNLRRTLYAEVLRAISSFENGAAFEIQKKAEEKGTLTVDEVEVVIQDLTKHPMMEPIIYDARQKMASRDLAFRDVYHGNIAEYLKAVSPEEYEKFIGNMSVDFDHLLDENQAVLERLKQ